MVADDRVRIEIAFDGGQVLAAFVPVSEADELERARTRAEVDFAHQVETYDGRADLIAMMTTYFGDSALVGRWLDLPDGAELVADPDRRVGDPLALRGPRFDDRLHHHPEARQSRGSQRRKTLGRRQASNRHTGARLRSRRAPAMSALLRPHERCRSRDLALRRVDRSSSRLQELRRGSSEAHSRAWSPGVVSL